MIKYIKAEFYRTFRSPMYKRFLAFCLAIMALILVVWKPMKFNEENQNIMLGMSFLATVAILIVVSVAVILAYKTKDTKVQILSYGMTRAQMFFYDLITMQVISIVTTLILGALAMATGFVADLLGLTTVPQGAYGEFWSFVLRLILLSLNLNNAIFGLTYLLNSVPLGILGHLLILPTALNIIYAFTINKAAGPYILDFMNIQPYTLLQNYATEGLVDVFGNPWTMIGASVIYVIVCFIIPGLLAFRKREIY